MKQNSIDRTLLLCRCMGLTAYSANGDSYAVSPRWLIANIIVIVLVVIACTQINELARLTDFSSSVECMVEFGTLCYICCTYLLFQLGFAKLGRVIVALKTEGAYVTRFKVNLAVCLVYSAFLCIFFFNLVQLMWYKRVNLTEYFKYPVEYMLVALVHGLHAYFSFEVRDRYRILNKKLQEPNCELGDLSGRFTRIARVNFEVWSFFGPLILVEVGLKVMYFTASLYQAIEGIVDVPMVLSWFLMMLVLVLDFVYAAHSIFAESTKTAMLYEQAMKRNWRHSKQGLFYLKVKYESKEFFICGLFPINWAFLLLMLENVVSNVVILLQFGKLDKSST